MLATLLLLLPGSASINLSGSLSTRSTPLTLRVAHQGRGILTFNFDPSKELGDRLILSSTTSAGYRPGWLHARHDILYSVSRTRFPDDKSSSGGIFGFDFGEGSKYGLPLEALGNVSSGGLGGVYCEVSDDGRTLAAANIDGSTVSVHPLMGPGQIGQATYIFHYNLTEPGPGTNDSQTISNPHATSFEPSGQYMFVPDRGADRLYAYRVEGPHSVIQTHNITFLPGTGPRHVIFKVFNATRTFMYMVGELDNTLSVLALDGVSNSECVNGNSRHQLEVTLLQTVSTLGADSTRSPPDNVNLASEVALSSDGKFAYVSNRNTVSYASDNLSIYSVHHEQDIHLVYLGQNMTYGKIPRHFSLSPDPDNRYVAVVNEVSNELVIMERLATSGFMGTLAGNVILGQFDIDQDDGPTAVIWG